MSRLSRFVTDFRNASAAIRTADELKLLIGDAAHELGFDHFALLHSASLFRRSAQLIRYDNYPDGWDRHLIKRGYKVVDPVLSLARRRVAAFLWADALSLASLTDFQQAILAEGARRGIRQGLTVPANVPGEPEGSVTFATHRRRHIGADRVMIAEAIGRIAFETARNLAGFSDRSAYVPHASDRVRECIFWIAHGKTDQDIAVILGIGLETVRTYVKAAFRSVGVITRGQLVHEALRLGIIDFVPSIPPFG